MMKIACQEQLLPGATLQEKWDFAHRQRLPGDRAARQGRSVLPRPVARAPQGAGRRGGDADGLRRHAALLRSLRPRPASGRPGAAEVAALGDRRARWTRRADTGVVRDVLATAPSVRAAARRGRRSRSTAGRPSATGRARGRRGGRAVPGAVEPVRGPHGQPARAGRLADRGGRARLGPDRHRQLPHEHRGSRSLGSDHCRSRPISAMSS